MSVYRFKRGDGEHSCHAWDWNYLLTLAHTYGWERENPHAAHSAVEITTVEASGLVTALEKAIVDLPDQPRRPQSVEISALPDDPLDWFSGEGKQTVRDFIEFCRGGGFRIQS